jgi:archaellum component FlaC
MSAILMEAMQTANAKLASTLESKLNKTQTESNKQTVTLEKNMTNSCRLKVELNKISENLDTKLASVSESLGARLNSASDSLNKTLNSMTANVTSK